MASEARGAPVQALERGLLLLAAFREQASLSLGELSTVLPIHRTSTLRLVQTLERQGFLARDSSGRYRLGRALYELGGLALSRLDVRTVARPAMEGLAAATGETVQLVLRDGADILVVDGIESARRVKVGAGRGERRPLHATASGKCFLAALGEDEVAAIYRRVPLAAATPRTIIRLDHLLAELRRARARGYAVNEEESEPGARFVAAPIAGPDGSIAAALALGAPADRLPRQALKQVGERVRDEARTASLSTHSTESTAWRPASQVESRGRARLPLNFEL